MWGIKDSPQCDFCGEIETIEHYFFNCEPVKKFWHSLETWLYGVTGVYMKFTILEIIFGTINHDCYNCSRNYVVLQAKKFIYDCKNDKTDIFILRFFYMLNNGQTNFITRSVEAL